MTTIAVIRETDLVTDHDVQAYCAAQAIQVQRDFSVDWGRSARIVSYGSSKKVRSAWPLYLRDHSDIPNALGYHTIDDNRVPTAFVFIADDLRHGLDWRVTASHEVLETLGDPTANLVRPYPDGQHVAYEACDPIEADQFGYEIDGVRLSDFVHQAWFTGRVNPRRKHPYDFTGALTAPLTLAPGGYIALEKDGNWTQLTAQSVPGVTSRVHTSGRHFLRGGFPSGA